MDKDMIKELAARLTEAAQGARLTLRSARCLAESAEEKAAELNLPVVVSVVDDGGNLLLLHRMEGSLLASLSLSPAKAFTALALKMTTERAARDILPGRPLYGLQETHPGQFCLFGGGVPLFCGDRCVGAVGISGGTVEQDVRIAEYAAAQFLPR